MRAKFWLFPAVFVLVLGTLVYSTQAQAQEDVLVDFSVLDSLVGNNRQSYSDGPLFPEVKPATKVAVKKSAPKKSKPVVKKANKPAKKITITAKKDIKVIVKEPISNSNSGLSPEDLKDSPFAVAPSVVVVDETLPAPTAPVEIKTEPLANIEPAVTMEPINGSTALPKTLDNSQVYQESPIPSADADESKINYMQETPVSTSTVVESSIPAMSNNTQQPTIDAVPEYLQEPISINAPAEVNPVAPLVPATIDADGTLPAVAPIMLATEIPNEIVFAEDSSDLTDGNKQQLDNLLASFEDAQNNKIAIYSFNIENGKDVFRKKRLSLNRAIEIRSYLLAKGYKNFSIKVVNTDEDDAKENRVVVEEFK